MRFNDHTFIYNTTRKLIYFNTLKNKIVKELPNYTPVEEERLETSYRHSRENGNPEYIME